MKSYTSIKENREFRFLFKKGNSYVTHGFVCYYLKRRDVRPNCGSPDVEVCNGICNRLGIVASKKVGNAVARNRAKRVIREAFRLAEPRLNALITEKSDKADKSVTRGYDFVFVARGKTPHLKSTQIYELIEKMFSEIGKA